MTPSPVKYEEVTISGTVYQLKFGAIAEYIMSELGVSLTTFRKDIGSPQAFSIYLKVFSALVAHHFRRQGLSVPTPDQWAGIIEAQGDRAVQLKISNSIIDAVVLTFYPNVRPTVEMREPVSVMDSTPPVN